MNPRTAWIFELHQDTQMTNAKKTVVRTPKAPSDAAVAADALFVPAPRKPATQKGISYAELLKQYEELSKQIAIVREEELVEVRATIRQLIDTYELQAEFKFAGGAKKAGSVKTAIAPKFRCPDSGATWSGRGKTPSWLAGKDKTLFLIA
jgi:DNA-binding protein H-NS